MRETYNQNKSVEDAEYARCKAKYDSAPGMRTEMDGNMDIRDILLPTHKISEKPGCYG